MKDLSVVIVNYKSSQVLRNCLNSIVGMRFNGTYEVVVLDNHSFDAGWGALRTDFPQFSFFELPKNEGFAAGNNAGIRKVTGKTILLLNPDTEVTVDAIQILYDRLVADSSLGVVGPKLFYGDQTLQVRFIPKKIPRLRHLFFEMFYIDKLFSKNTFINEYFGAGFDYDKEQDVEQVSGACFFIKREVIDRIGPMDERFFLYFEETDWCARALKESYRIRYVPKAEVVHFEGKSSNSGSRTVRAYYESELFFFLKHYGWGAMAVLSVINALGLLYRLLFSGYYLFLGKPQKLQRFWKGLCIHLDPSTYRRVLALKHA